MYLFKKMAHAWLTEKSQNQQVVSYFFWEILREKNPAHFEHYWTLEKNYDFEV